MKRRHFIWYALLFAAGCTISETPRSQVETSELQPLSKLRFAVTDAKGMEDLQRDYENFRATLEQVLEIPVEFFPVEDYFAAAAALQSNTVDLVWCGPAEYVVINARTRAVPIIGVARNDYYTVIGASADSGIQSAADLKGRTLDVRREGSTSSHLGAIKILIDAGLDPLTDVNIIMSGEHSLKVMETGAADAIARNPYRYQDALAEAGVSKSEYPIIASGDPLPGDVIMISSHLEAARQSDIQTRIIDNQQLLIDSILSVKSIGFRFKESTLISTSDTDYNMIREAYQAIGQDDFLQ